ncbi:hypothetical protein PybrP1_000883 [[Pythium] brassicae (nom. inval.)]|nr:hypothetical protein PybrP1_000883 [[Pythium] brassicae (nom. inval.)]
MRFQSTLQVLLVAAAVLGSNVGAQSGSAAVGTSNVPPEVGASAVASNMTAGSTSGSTAGGATVGVVVTRAPTTIAPTATPTAAPTPAPIATAAPGSSTFQLVPNKICPDIVVEKIDAIYSKNRAIFEECVGDAEYQIYPHPGPHPTAKQIHAMVTSPPCIAMFMAVVLANFPTCDLGGMPLKSVVETLLKVMVDVAEGREAPSAERFQKLLNWRRDMNLAQQAGVPFDGNSTIYREFTTNLQKALASRAVRVTSDLTLEYKLENGTYTHGAISFSALQNRGAGSGSDVGEEGQEESGVVGTVRPANSASAAKANEDSSGSTTRANVKSGASALAGMSAWLVVAVAAAFASS